MNKIQLVGRLTKDPEIRYTDGGSSIARFNIAVDRRFKTDNGPTADFIPCVAFGKTAEFIEKYFNKGSRIGLCGRLQSGKYDTNNNETRYTLDCIVEEVEFVESKSNQTEQPNSSKASSDGFVNIPDGIDEELPFN